MAASTGCVTSCPSRTPAAWWGRALGNPPGRRGASAGLEAAVCRMECGASGRTVHAESETSERHSPNRKNIWGGSRSGLSKHLRESLGDFESPVSRALGFAGLEFLIAKGVFLFSFFCQGTHTHTRFPLNCKLWLLFAYVRVCVPVPAGKQRSPCPGRSHWHRSQEEERLLSRMGGENCVDPRWSTWKSLGP